MMVSTFSLNARKNFLEITALPATGFLERSPVGDGLKPSATLIAIICIPTEFPRLDLNKALQ